MDEHHLAFDSIRVEGLGVAGTSCLSTGRAPNASSSRRASFARRDLAIRVRLRMWYYAERRDYASLRVAYSPVPRAEPPMLDHSRL